VFNKNVHGDDDTGLKILPKQFIKEFTKIFDMYNKQGCGLMKIDDLKTLFRQTFQREDKV
jgi:hypothetical protein